MYAPWKGTPRHHQAAVSVVAPPRDMEIEDRIARRHAADTAGPSPINSYGGMGMDSIPDDERALRVAEVDYMTTHPEVYPHKIKRHFGATRANELMMKQGQQQ